jgi:hypothetical protein
MAEPYQSKQYSVEKESGPEAPSKFVQGLKKVAYAVRDFAYATKKVIDDMEY